MAFVPGTGTEHFSAPLQAPMGTMYAAKLASSPRKGRSLRYGPELDILGSLRKPLEPDFTDDDDDTWNMLISVYGRKWDFVTGKEPCLLE